MVSLSSTLIPQIFRLTKLKFLNLAHNSLSGTLFDTSEYGSWADLQALEMLELHYNNFDGSIPITMQQLPNLLYISLQNNNFTGDVPILTMSQRLQGVDFGSNKFTRWPREYFTTTSF
jgi:Leucine-rich repeat (LRR) protein